MKKQSLFLAIFFFSFPVFAEMDAITEAQTGKYILIGKAIDSDRTYLGKVKISADGDSLSVIRTIDGNIITGHAAIEPVLNGDAKVLRIRFSDNGEKFEETCLFRGDLDNNSRISCYLYNPGSATQNPGLEAMFHDHTAE